MILQLEREDGKILVVKIKKVMLDKLIDVIYPPMVPKDSEGYIKLVNFLYKK